MCKESAGSDPYAALAGIRQLKEIEASRHIAGAAITLLDYLFELWVEQHGWDAAFAGAKTLEGEERELVLSAAHAVARASDDQFLPLAGPDQPLASAGTISVLGPGTGLGVAHLHLPGDGSYRVTATEGGHIDFAPLDTIEDAILAHFRKSHTRVSIERTRE